MIFHANDVEPNNQPAAVAMAVREGGAFMDRYRSARRTRPAGCGAGETTKERLGGFVGRRGRGGSGLFDQSRLQPGGFVGMDVTFGRGSVENRLSFSQFRDF
jgi:hypothetical protein